MKEKVVYVLVKLHKEDNQVNKELDIDFSILSNPMVSIVDVYENESEAINDGFKLLEELRAEGKNALFVPVKFVVK